MQRYRLAPVALLLAAALAACSNQSTQTPQASVRVVTSKTSLVVGDTMLVKAGVQYTDGRFEEFTNYTVTVTDTNFARVRTGTKIVEAKEPGFATVRVTAAVQPPLQIDTTYFITEAP